MTTAHEPGRTAYEARFAGEKQGPQGTVDPWEMLCPSAKAIWARVEAAVESQLPRAASMRERAAAVAMKHGRRGDEIARYAIARDIAQEIQALASEGSADAA